MQFCYQTKLNTLAFDVLLEGLKAVRPEKNTITDKFKTLNVQVANAYDSQALLQLKRNIVIHLSVCNVQSV